VLDNELNVNRNWIQNILGKIGQKKYLVQDI